VRRIWTEVREDATKAGERRSRGQRGANRARGGARRGDGEGSDRGGAAGGDGDGTGRFQRGRKGPHAGPSIENPNVILVIADVAYSAARGLQEL
jgi:hypothetical protein